MNRYFLTSYLTLLFLLSFSACNKRTIDKKEFITVFESSQGTETCTYDQGISFWKKMASHFDEIELMQYGTTDSGKPLHLVVLSLDKEFSAEEIHASGKVVMMINNAIHPGEPDGVEASQMLFRDLLLDSSNKKLLNNTVLITIPFYNVGGVLNRNSTTRVNQEGPESYGFRGNTHNLDLNRDFIKADSENAKSFAQIFHEWKPDVLVDTHVSNGANYQHVLTNLVTQEDKLGEPLRSYIKQKVTPYLESNMEKEGFPICPYVNVWGRSPDNGGIRQFIDLPRYSTGYAALFQTIGYMTEAHMLKPFKQRTEATYAYLKIMLEFTNKNAFEIKKIRGKAIQNILEKTEFPINWKRDEEKYETIIFKGYKAYNKISEVTGKEILLYDQKKPFEKMIPFYNTYRPNKIVKKPFAYLIPKNNKKVVERLKLNNVTIYKLTKGQKFPVSQFYVESYKTVNSPYEGHYLHYNVEGEWRGVKKSFQTGDYLVFTDQETNRYIIETLEPEAPDSFFCWNFFDSWLQQKEGFSSYVFEAKAQGILDSNEQLRKEFEMYKQSNPDMSNYGLLDFIYKNSEFHESNYQKLPVYRLEDALIEKDKLVKE